MRTRLICLAVLGMALAGPLAARAQQCDDFSDCTNNDMCDDEGNCSGTPANGGSCDDFNDCTTNDRCQPDGSCSGTPAGGGSCDDFNECTTDDLCIAAGPKVFCFGTPGGTGPCAGGCGTCQPTGQCLGDMADNGNECTPFVDLGPCFSGTCTISAFFAICQPGPKVCPDTDGDKCTDNCNPENGQCQKTVPRCIPQCETCDGATGQCAPANLGSSCDDFNPCSASSRCEEFDLGGTIRGLCQPGEATGGPTPTPTVPPTGACVGDCNGNGVVAINELIVGVNIALGNASVTQCESFDVNDNGTVAINELIGGVGAALNGCA